MQRSSVTLVIGGAASGKSAWAEDFVARSGLAKTYIATAEAHDAEMKAKIDAHRESRSGQGWRTIEASRDLRPALGTLDTEEIALIDCATIWLANTQALGQDLGQALEALIETMDQCQAPIVIVTNELGQGIVPAEPMTRAFRDAHGKMNQRLAAAADHVVLVTAGLPQVLKGDAPW